MGKLIIESSVMSFYRRALQPADSVLLDSGVNPYPALDMKKLSVVEGDWVTRDADGKVVLASSPTRLAYCVWVGDRTDAGAARSVTVLAGAYIAKTSVFDPTPTGGGAYAASTPLTTRGGMLDKAQAGEPIVAIAEGPVSAPTSEFPDGLLEFNTFQIGGLHA